MESGIPTTRSNAPDTECPPVLFLVFNKPHTTAQVLEAIRRATPSRLYIAADGPRSQEPGEAALCREVREIVSQIDWKCDVRTLFREENLGCRLGVVTGLDWFFEHETEGIILEDDCLPGASFFRFCAELLVRYRDTPRIMCVSGNNFQQGRRRGTADYYFSIYPHIWGWATWRRAWRLYDRNMDGWRKYRKSGLLRNLSSGRLGFERHWTSILNSVSRGEVDTWDYQWVLSCWAHNGLTCIPQVNLVKNIGFLKEATHTKDPDSKFANMPYEEISFPLVHPEEIKHCLEADEFTDEEVLEIGSQGNSQRGGVLRRTVRRVAELIFSRRGTKVSK